MSGRAIIIFVAGLIVISGVVFHNIEASSTLITQNYYKYYVRQESQDIAQTGAAMALRQIGNDINWRTGFPLMDLLSGKVQVTVSDSTFFGRKVIKIVSVGYQQYGTSLERRDTCITYQRRSFIPSFVIASVTTNNPVAANGSMTIDGRDHDTTGAVLAGLGTWGVWSTKAWSQGGSAVVGGTAAGLDFPPLNPANPLIIKQNQPFAGGYPGTPDSVMGAIGIGYPEGTLKAIAQSGNNGSRYTTNPATLTMPLSGVTYIELPSGGSWVPAAITGSGVLVIHNSAKNALLQNPGISTFKGILICDDIVHLHNTIIGAVVSLTPTPSAGNVIGNGTGAVLYSRMAIKKATEVAVMPPNGSQNAVAWRE
jgi:hypothetical protein